MVSTGADDGTMKPEALSEDGGVLPETLVVEGDKSIATSRGRDPRTGKPQLVFVRHSTPRCPVASVRWRESLSGRNDVVVYRRKDVGEGQGCVFRQVDMAESSTKLL